MRDGRATRWSGPARKKVDPPGGTTGRVGCGTGWMRRPCRTQYPRSECLAYEGALVQSISVIAGTNEAAAAVAVVGVTVVGSSDRGADDGGANEAGSDAPAKALGFGLGGGGSH